MFPRLFKTFRFLLASCFALLWFAGPTPAFAVDFAALDKDTDAALANLYQTSPRALHLSQSAKGILVFPKIVKAAFIVGGQGGDGVLIKGGQKTGYYSSSAATVGLTAGGQSFSYVIFFINDEALRNFENSNGFEVGVGPSVVMVDAGAGDDINTLTGKNEVYAFVYGQKGLMAGIDLQGTKITKIK